MGLFGNTLYYPGCLSKLKLKHIADNYEQILKKIGVKFITIKDIELCCGAPALYAGYRQDFLEIAEKNAEILRNMNVSKIITNCPSCYRMFNNEYKIKTEHIAQTIYNNLSKLNKDFSQEEISYHDPCELGRKSKIYEEPRQILRHIGFNVVEMKNHHDQAFCCGAGGLVKQNSPRIADRMAMLRLTESKTKKLITTCPMCYMHLKQNAQNIEVLELSEVLL